MLIPTTELGQFDSMVMPFELEAYDILKSRSGKQRNIFYFCIPFIQLDIKHSPVFMKETTKYSSLEKQVSLHRAKEFV